MHSAYCSCLSNTAMCLYVTDMEMSDSNGEACIPQSSSSRDTKRHKRRGSDDEKHHLLDTFGTSVIANTMPTGKFICAFAWLYCGTNWHTAAQYHCRNFIVVYRFLLVLLFLVTSLFLRVCVCMCVCVCFRVSFCVSVCTGN